MVISCSVSRLGIVCCRFKCLCKVGTSTELASTAFG